MGNIKGWRNDRIHARVLRSDDGLALYNWRTRQRLSMSCEECETKIEEVWRVIVTLTAYAPRLVGMLDYDRLFEQVFSAAPDLD